MTHEIIILLELQNDNDVNQYRLVGQTVSENEKGVKFIVSRLIVTSSM